MKTYVVRRNIYKLMKLLLALIILTVNSAIAQKYSFTGSLLNFDNNVVSKCIVEAQINTFNTEKIQITSLKYLKRDFQNIDLKLFIKNGVDGNLYLGEVNDVRFIFNTDSIFKILEITILDTSQNYKCTYFYEK